MKMNPPRALVVDLPSNVSFTYSGAHHRERAILLLFQFCGCENDAESVQRLEGEEGRSHIIEPYLTLDVSVE
jgi:hypothetical protein